MKSRLGLVVNFLNLSLNMPCQVAAFSHFKRHCNGSLMSLRNVAEEGVGHGSMMLANTRIRFYREAIMGSLFLQHPIINHRNPF
jgi:hypothetical protein